MNRTDLSSGLLEGSFGSRLFFMLFWHLCPIFLVLTFAVLEFFGLIHFLWVYPTLSQDLTYWMFFLICDLYWVRAFSQQRREGRVLLWLCSLLMLSVLAGQPGLGIFACIFPLFLWLLARKKTSEILFPLFLLAAIPLAHGDHLYAIFKGKSLLSYSVLIRIFFVFFFFRTVAWWVKNMYRKENQSLFETYMYFLHPVFWLQPFHAGYIVPHKIQQSELGPIKYFWILLGLLFSILFSLALQPTVSILNSAYLENKFFLLFLVGPIAFVFTMLEKARVSYLTAGLFSLSGVHLEPDFKKPWLAKTLFDYWRRFHYWVLEWYWEVLYLPLVIFFSRKLGEKWGRILTLVFTFSIGGCVSHYIAYPAPLSSCLFVSTLFGLATSLHYWLEGMPVWFTRLVTYASIWILYTIAYPVFGLGWGFEEMIQFLGG